MYGCNYTVNERTIVFIEVSQPIVQLVLYNHSLILLGTVGLLIF